MSSLSKLLKEVKHLRIYQYAVQLSHIKSLRKNLVYYQRYGIRKRVWQSLSHEMIMRPGEDIPWMDQEVSEETIRTREGFTSFSPSVQEGLLQWKERGFLELPGYFSRDQVDALEQSVTEGLTEKDVRRYHSNRLLNLHTTNSRVDAVFRDPGLLSIMSFLFGKKVYPFKSTNFYKSSSQTPHSDHMFLTTEPRGYLLAVWVALEDIEAGSGELTFYPGSHRLPYLFNKDIAHGHTPWKLDPKHHVAYDTKVQELIRKHGLEPVYYRPKKGDVLIWHANLLHGGSPVVYPELTRKSMVSHYFAEDVLCYQESMERPVVIL